MSWTPPRGAPPPPSMAPEDGHDASPVADPSSPAAPPGTGGGPPADDRSITHAGARAGQLTPGWQVAVTIAWVATLVALGAVWSASRQLGLSTWWLGPRAQPQPVWLTLAPFVPPAVVALLALSGRRYVPWAGLAAAACIAAVGIGDLGRVTGFGVVELVIAAAAALVSVAAFAGTYRPAGRDPARTAE